jgi:uncharacterized protein (TIGR02001 family)
MNSRKLALATLVAIVSLPGAALADLSVNAGAVSEYRYRGISQSRLKPAVQGGVDYSLGGFYVGAWGSSIKWIKDAGGDAGAEYDVYGGYKGEFSGLAYDVGVLTYQYPSHKLSVSPNTTEIYGALTFGPATLKYSHSVTNLFGFADSKNSGYVDLSASFDVGGGISLAPHVGYQKVAKNGDFSYTDYSLIASYEVLKGLSVTGGVIGADVKKIGGTPAYVSPAGKNLGKAAAVVGAKYTYSF